MNERERLARLRRLRDLVVDHPLLYKRVCARIVHVESDDLVPNLYGTLGHTRELGSGRKVPRLPMLDDDWASQNGGGS